jgi:hypothetical protein
MVNRKGFLLGTAAAIVAPPVVATVEVGCSVLSTSQTTASAVPKSNSCG